VLGSNALLFEVTIDQHWAIVGTGAPVASCPSQTFVHHPLHLLL